MRTCPDCRQDNPDNANFCNHCGHKFSLATYFDQLAPLSAVRQSKRAAERRQLTILFCDLVGSTPLSERLDPEEYRQVITDYHRVAEKVIRRYKGHVAQYLGDGLLVYFGYPEGLEDAPRVGVQAGLGILKAVAQANQAWEASGRDPIKVRIGIHTGLVVVDDHLALGETVNVAARLEGLAPHNGLVISPQTHRLVEGWFKVNSTGKHTLKGITEPMEIFQVLSETGARSRLEVTKRRGLSPLVGREQDLEVLRKHWIRAKEGQGSLLLLNGEAGIGKSRLVDTLEEEVKKGEGSVLLKAHCSAYQRNSPFFPLTDLLEKSLLKLEAGEKVEAKLEKLENFLLESDMDFKTAMPLLAEFLSLPSASFPPLVISPIAKRQLVMKTLSEILLSQVRHGPLLFILEDLHWADASTLDWLQQFMEQLEDQPLFVLCTTRPSYRPDWTDHPAVTSLTLDRLSAEEMTDICAHQSQGKALPQEILRQIIDKTEGVPLFVEELTKMILESDFLVETADGYKVDTPMSALAIPSTLQDSLLARLDRLSDAKEVVQTGAVLGRAFTFDMLNAVLPRQAGSLEHALSQLLDAEIFNRNNGDQQPVYQFKHALIQDAAYDSLLKTRRQQLHYRVSDVLKHQFAEKVEAQPELLAHHYTEAGHPREAIPLWLKAGQLSTRKNANTEAIAQLEKGLALLPQLESATERKNLELDFQLTLGGSFVVAYGFPHPKVRETFDKARQIAQTTEVSPKLALILMNLLSYYFNTEDWGAHADLAEYVMKLADDPEHGYWFELAAKQLVDGPTGIIWGNFQRARQGGERVLEIFDPSLPFSWELAPSGYIEIGAKAWLMVCLQAMGYTAEARRLYTSHLDYARDHQDSMTLYHIHTFPALYQLEAREWQSAEAIIDNYLPVVRSFGDPVFILTADVYHSLARAFQGDGEALEKAANLINACFQVGFNAFAVTVSSWLGSAYFHFKDYEAALAWTDRILDHVNKTGSHIHTTELLRTRALTLQALGEPHDIVAGHLQQALELARQQSARTYELRAAADLARLWRKNGKAREGRELLKGVYDWFADEYETKDLQEAKVLLHQLEQAT